MAPERTFERITARHVASADGVQVKFVNAEQLRYGIGDRWIDLDAETVIAADGAPDGRVVSLSPTARWNDGKTLSENEAEQIRRDLAAAAGPLRSTLRFRR